MSSLDEYLALWSDHGLALDPRIFRAAPAEPTRGTDAIREWIGDCRRCGLYACRNKIVVGDGSATARLLFVGEAPSTDDDTQGLPFTGKPGELFDKILSAMGYRRNQVFLTSVVKCRPPKGRPPTPEEIQSCLPFLKAQIEAVNPSVIVALGNVATSVLVSSTEPMSQLRGRFYPLPWNPLLPVLPTFAPAYLLDSPETKRLVWDDMKKVMQRL